MRGIGFSLKGLLAVVTMVAVGVFALLNAIPLWASIVVSFTLLLFLTALLAIVYRRGESRSFWVGFAIFGWAYFVLTNPPLGESYQSRLPTHAALETLHNSVKREVEVDDKLIHRLASSIEDEVLSAARLQGSGRPLFAALPHQLSFVRIGHCLWAWLLALVGGFLARYFYLAQEQKAASPGDT